MFLNNRSVSWKTLPLVVVVVAAGVWLGADSVEARGRSATLKQNVLTLSAAATAVDNAPARCHLQSLVEWEPLGSKVQVEFVLQHKKNPTSSWAGNVSSGPQLLPGKATSASVDWDVAPGYEYRHWFKLYSVKGKAGAFQNQQLAAEFSDETPPKTVVSCGV